MAKLSRLELHLLSSYYLDRVGANAIDDVSVRWDDDAIQLQNNNTGMLSSWIVVAPETINAIKIEAIRYLCGWITPSVSLH